MSEIKQNEDWPELYRRALFEEDRDKLPALLELAHQAVQARVRELWYSPAERQSVSNQERRELDAAAYFLGLLKSLEARKPAGDSDRDLTQIYESGSRLQAEQSRSENEGPPPEAA